MVTRGVHKVEGPSYVFNPRRHQWDVRPLAQSALCAVGKVQAHILVNTANSLIVPAITTVPHTAKTQSKTLVAMLGHDLLEL